MEQTAEGHAVFCFTRQGVRGWMRKQKVWYPIRQTLRDADVITIFYQRLDYVKIMGHKIMKGLSLSSNE